MLYLCIEIIYKVKVKDIDMDYEKKYKEALEGIRELYNSDLDMIRVKRLRRRFEHIFPELKESEDEKIKREIVAYINELADLKNEKIPTKWLDWLEKQGDKKESDEEWEVTTGLYKCTKRMFDGTPESRLWFEIGNLYRCISKNDIAEFESSYGHTVFLIDPVVRKHFIKVKD